MSGSSARRLGAELLGTGVLVAAVVGSGIMAQRLSPDDVGLQLLENVGATVLALAVLVVVLGPVSGAHLNPAVTLAEAWSARGAQDRGSLGAVAGYVVAQALGGLAGALLANVMFDVPTSPATTSRGGTGQLVGEVVATAGLVVVVRTLALTGRTRLAAPVVAAWIGAAAWFTSSTSFANPAVTAARAVSDTFAGIAPGDVPPFVVAQLVGAAVGLAVVAVLHPRTPPEVREPAPVAIDVRTEPEG